MPDLKQLYLRFQSDRRLEWKEAPLFSILQLLTKSVNRLDFKRRVIPLGNVTGYCFLFCCKTLLRETNKLVPVTKFMRGSGLRGPPERYRYWISQKNLKFRPFQTFSDLYFECSILTLFLGFFQAYTEWVFILILIFLMSMNIEHLYHI